MCRGKRSAQHSGLGSPEELAACLTYSPDGRLLSMTNALGLKVENAYTTKNELLTVHAFGVKQAEFAYDGAGQMTRITDALGNVKRYEYQGGGRPKSITDAIGTVMQFTYDGSNNVSSTTNGAGETENDYLYAGERFDRTTELYQLRARYMDPKTGTS